MIGVISEEHRKASVEEFFELFKTPWEHFRSDGTYEVIVSTDPAAPVPPAKLAIVYAAEETGLDRQWGNEIHRLPVGGEIHRKGAGIPVYGPLAAFRGAGDPFLSGTGGTVLGKAFDRSGGRVLRLGYDLFGEVDLLLRRGQPVKNAGIPTLELHIAMLREWILESGIPLVEIPPSPHGYDFTVCLTHDIDFMRIRDHKFDHTMFGFIYRSLVPRYLKGLDRKTFLARYRKNFGAMMSLPLVYMGFLPDPWSPLEQYPEVEKEVKSTFFLIPFRGRPGASPDGTAAKYRGAKYDAGRHREPIRSLYRRGCEVGLHGIDSWRDSRKGREELDAIRGITGRDRIGVRMHWLYFSDETPKRLQEAGFRYDSSLGYNDTVGFRSGTTQVFRLPGADSVFELPLHVQDTAMLSPGRMNASESEAIALCGKLMKKFEDHGGVLTVNWHDRSLAPERNWDAAYLALLGMLREKRTWFATAGEAVAWFEKRRASRFEPSGSTEGVPEVRTRIPQGGNGPPLTLRVHRPPGASRGAQRFRDSIVAPLARGGAEPAGI
jgi:peptidoglycan/xylan/chitin deacetylase (PgdA/CDA1 family)